MAKRKPDPSDKQRRKAKLPPQQRKQSRIDRKQYKIGRGKKR